MWSGLITEQEPGEHEHPAGGGEEREDGEVPGLPSLGLFGALGLDAEALGPAQRVHLLEQVEVKPCLSSETHLARSSASFHSRARRLSRMALTPSSPWMPAQGRGAAMAACAWEGPQFLIVRKKKWETVGDGYFFPPHTYLGS